MQIMNETDRVLSRQREHPPWQSRLSNRLQVDFQENSSSVDMKVVLEHKTINDKADQRWVRPSQLEVDLEIDFGVDSWVDY